MRRPGHAAHPRTGLAACRILCAGILCAALLAGCDGAPEPAAPARRPNLLLVTIDTLRADRLSCYGGPPGVGDAICSLANGGTRFTWAFSAAPFTAPSVASILTGRYPSFHTVSQSATSYLRNDATTLAEELERAGYTTAAFVSNPVLDRTRNLGQGFGVYDQRMTRQERNRPGYAEREAQTTTDAALAWAQVAAESPWFLWVHFQDPHGPYEPPDPHPERDDPGAEPLPVLENHSGRGGIPAYQALPGLRTPGPYRRRYLDEIRYLDPHVKRLVDGLDALGEAPALLLTSDHGEAFGEDGYWFAHGHSVGLDQIRVPLLWRPPPAAGDGALLSKTEVVDTPVSGVDVAPTLLAVAGLEIPREIQGRPLPVAGLDADRRERAIFAEHGRRSAVIAGGRYYARERRHVEEGERDPNSGGTAGPLPARTADLTRPDAGNGALPAYTNTEPGEGPSADLEILLARFLDSGRGRTGAVREDVPDRLKEQLRALGYLD